MSPRLRSFDALEDSQGAGGKKKSKRDKQNGKKAKMYNPPLAFNHNNGILIKLPYLFQTLYTTYIHKQCPQCFPVDKKKKKNADGSDESDDDGQFKNASSRDQQPKISFLCLLSGRHLCSASNQVEQNSMMQQVGGSTNCPNSFTKHHGKCGHGLSVLLNLLSGLVHIHKDNKICVWGAIYLDAYGEEDRYLSRGKPLFLSQTRLQQLTSSLAQHSFENDAKLVWKPVY